jgi:hypothetical protein
MKESCGDKMREVNALMNSPAVLGKLSLPEGREATLAVVESKPGCAIDRYTVGVSVDGRTIGKIYYYDAVTFRNWVYVGKDPRDESKEVKISGNLPLPCDPVTFSQRFCRFLERRAQAQLAG